MNPKKILVIDDEQDIRDNISRILKQLGHTVQTADSIRNAIKILVENTDFDLITCDIMIPAAGGFELIDQIKSDPLYSNIPILMISGVDSEVLQYTQHAANDVLSKPFTTKDLTAKVQALLKQ